MLEAILSSGQLAAFVDGNIGMIAAMPVSVEVQPTPDEKANIPLP
jgi:hypothetical protein